MSILFYDRTTAGDELAIKVGEYMLQPENIDYKKLEKYIPEEFYAVGQFYKQFDQVSDEDINQ